MLVMVTLLRKLFIKNYDQVDNEQVRYAHGRLGGIFGIVTNCLLIVLKLTAAFVSAMNNHWIFSLALIGDAVNNISDAASSIITLIGFKLSQKPADADHPFGHQRIEYIAGLVVAVFVIAGLGGGTGTGAMPVVIDAAQSQGAMTFAIGISPFMIEGDRKNVARKGWEHIRSICENTLLVDNDKVLLRMPDLTMPQAFGEVNISIRAHVLANVDTIAAIFRRAKSVPVQADETPRPKASYPIETLISA